MARDLNECVHWSSNGIIRSGCSGEVKLREDGSIVCEECYQEPKNKHRRPMLRDFPENEKDRTMAIRTKVCMVYEDRVLLGEIQAVAKTAKKHRGDGYKVIVKHFNGEQWPIVPYYDQVSVIACRECALRAPEAGENLCEECEAKLGDEYDDSDPDVDQPSTNLDINEIFANIRDVIDSARKQIAPIMDDGECFAPEHLRIAYGLLMQAKAHVDLAERHTAREIGEQR